MIGLKDIVKANDDLMMADLEGEAVLLNVQSGRYFGLNEVGTSIWSLMKEPCSVGDIVDAIHAEYNVESGVLNNDVLSFLENMKTRKLIQRISHVHV